MDGQRCGGVSRGRNPSAFLAVAAAEGGRPAARRCRAVHLVLSAVTGRVVQLRRRRPGAAGAGHAARQPAASRVVDRRRLVLHHRVAGIHARRSGPRPAAGCGAHLRCSHVHADCAARGTAGPGPGQGPGWRGPRPSGHRHHARAIDRRRHAGALGESRPLRHGRAHPAHPAGSRAWRRRSRRRTRRPPRPHPTHRPPVPRRWRRPARGSTSCAQRCSCCFSSATPGRPHWSARGPMGGSRPAPGWPTSTSGPSCSAEPALRWCAPCRSWPSGCSSAGGSPARSASGAWATSASGSSGRWSGRIRWPS